MKIAVIGNAGGGKTTLSRRLGEIHGIPVTHVDSIQFIPGMQIRAMEETRQILGEIAARDAWLIDGFGPLDLIETRFGLAHKVVMVDFPLWRHAWWCAKRQAKSFWKQREELPAGCYENSWAHTVKLFKTLWRVHTQMRPELLRILGREGLRQKVVFVHTLGQWRKLYNSGLPR